MSRNPDALWRNPDFLKFWIGETISLFGSQITVLALPLTAVLALEATPGQMGLLGAAQFAPYLLVTLFAGVWVDRNHRKPYLIAANLVRAALLVTVPLLAFLGLLRMEYLYLTAFLLGVFTVVFDIGYQAYFPSLVERERPMDGNSRLLASASAAEIGGPGLAGILVEWITAPLALLVDAFSFLVGALSLALIRKPESEPDRQRAAGGYFGDIRAGMGIVFGNRYLRAILGEAALFNLFWMVINSLFVLYATRELEISPGLLGFIMATANVGALGGSLVAARAARRFGLGRALVGAMIVACTSPLLIPLAAGARWAVVGPLVAAYFLMSFGVALSNVHVISLRQTIAPDKLLGRMNASYRFFVTGTVPLGSLLGGVLGETIGLRPTLLVGAVGLWFALLPVLFSPVPGLVRLPEEAQGEDSIEEFPQRGTV